MAEDALDTVSVKEEVKLASLPDDIESQIRTAMRSRIAHFKEESDSFTLESVRRLIEKDLGLENRALDIHKRFVKKCLQECMEGSADNNASKNSGELVDAKVNTTSDSEVAEPTKGRQSKKEVKEPFAEDEEKLEDSPVMGLLTAKTESIKTEREETKEISQSEITKAIRKRASYVLANSEEVTMAGLRRLLEEDMELDKHALDPFKKFISKQLDEVLKSHEVSTASSKAKKNVKKNPQTKASRKSSTKESFDSEEEEDEEDKEVEEEEKTKRKVVSKKRLKNSEGLNKRNRPEKETKAPSKKRIKAPKKDGDSEAEDGGVASEDGHSQSSAEKTVKRKEASTPVYGKRVEHLRSIIKLCGMSVPPVIYKKVKQAPENKREAHLIKELEGILSKEGLSPNPSEKEIKEVKKKKERTKELEGIDTSNIVSSSRRRSTTSFVLPKPKITDASDDDDDDNSEDDGDDEDNEDEDGGDEGNDGSQSEESNEEEDEDSD